MPAGGQRRLVSMPPVGQSESSHERSLQPEASVSQPLGSASLPLSAPRRARSHLLSWRWLLLSMLWRNEPEPRHSFLKLLPASAGQCPINKAGARGS